MALQSGLALTAGLRKHKVHLLQKNNTFFLSLSLFFFLSLSFFTHTHTHTKEYPGYDTSLPSAMRLLFSSFEEFRVPTSWSLLSGRLRAGAVLPVRVSPIGQINMFEIYLYWIRILKTITACKLFMKRILTWSYHWMIIYIYIYIKVKFVTLVEDDLKVPFSITTGSSCRGGRFSIPWIAPLYHWSLLYNAEYIYIYIYIYNKFKYSIIL